jgi:hypothetical protein
MCIPRQAIASGELWVVIKRQTLDFPGWRFACLRLVNFTPSEQKRTSNIRKMGSLQSPADRAGVLAAIKHREDPDGFTFDVVVNGEREAPG